MPGLFPHWEIIQPDGTIKKGIFSRQEACLETRQAHIGNFSDYMCDQLIQEASKVHSLTRSFTHLSQDEFEELTQTGYLAPRNAAMKCSPTRSED